MRLRGGDKGFNVLVVEDDTSIFGILKKILEEDTSFPFHVDHAISLDEATAKIRSTPYHMLLVEADLEGHPGLKLLEEVNRANLHVPFVLLTPVRDDRLVREALRLGVADVIIKSESQLKDLTEKLRASFLKYYRKDVKVTGMKRLSARSAKIAGAAKKIAEGEEKSKDLAIRDELTGLYNHGYLQERIVQEFTRAARYSYPISCVVVDIDHFKIVNEDRGYRLGDTMLKECAELLFENARLSDLIARFGGEEFAVLLPHTNYEGAAELATRLRQAFAGHVFGDTEEINLTVSIGISSFPEDPMKNRCELLTFANQALFRSKAAGRNRITQYKDIVPIFGEFLPSLKISEEKILLFRRRLSEISDQARRSYIDASKALIVALESKDRFTAGHAANSAKYCMQTAEIMGMGLDEVEVVEHAALLHDIGKLCIPDHILLKPGKLTFSEYEVMKQHSYLGYKILKPIKFLQEEAVLVLHHHEWFNGEGYPCRLSGNEIPLGARIIAVIDSYDTIRIAGGRYKKTMTVENGINELISCSGTQFDPEVVKAFIEVLKMRKELNTDHFDKEKLEEVIRQVHLQK